jgi:hypothetical protein
MDFRGQVSPHTDGSLVPASRLKKQRHLLMKITPRTDKGIFSLLPSSVVVSVKFCYQNATTHRLNSARASSRPPEYALGMAIHDKPGIEAQVRQWMRDNKKENSHLEFKLLIDLSNVSTKAEFVRDVISLANSEGGYAREDGLLVIGFRNGKYQDVASSHYDGATFSQIVDAYISPLLTTRYEEFSNGKRGRTGLLVLKPDPDVIYVVRKVVRDKNSPPELLPGQAWGRRGDRKLELTGDDIHQRFREILDRKIEAAKTELQERIDKIEEESGPVLEVKRIRYDMEVTRDWTQMEALIPKLLPYAREYDYKVQDEVLNALAIATGRASQGMTIGVADEVDSVLGELMPVGTGGVHHPSRTPITNQQQLLLERIGHATFEITWNACRYLRNIEMVELGALRFWYLIRITTLNGLRYALAALRGLFNSSTGSSSSRWFLRTQPCSSKARNSAARLA